MFILFILVGVSFCLGVIAGFELCILFMRKRDATTTRKEVDPELGLLDAERGSKMEAERDGKTDKEVVIVQQEPLHWKPELYRRGLGDMLHRVNHIALIVRDVGHACSFYTEVIGFQQIRRPNFDRHGVWLTMGNIELHLIKGTPVTAKGQHPADLIVPHISIECHDIKAVQSRLHKLKAKFPELAWRQNISVPTAEASKEAHFESDHTNDDGKILQFFLEDPDGYWMEFCNCDELDEFCLGEEAPHVPKYSADCAGVRIQARADMYIRVKRWIRRARASLKAQRKQDFLNANLVSASPLPHQQVDEEKLSNLKARLNTYSDLCQAFSVEEMQAFLANANNDVPKVMLMMRQVVLNRGGQPMIPPAYIETATKLQKCQPLITSPTHSNEWFGEVSTECSGAEKPKRRGSKDAYRQGQRQGGKRPAAFAA